MGTPQQPGKESAAEPAEGFVVDQRLKKSRDDVLARKLRLHQGGVRHEAPEDGGVDGAGGEVHRQDHGRQGLHLRRVQAREGQLPRPLQGPGEGRGQEMAGSDPGDPHGREGGFAETEFDKLEGLIKNYENLIPTVMKTQIMVDLYWKCYAYGDELKPHIEFLDGIML